MTCAGEQHVFTPGSTACQCGRTHSRLNTGGLPYPSWVLNANSHHGLAHSNYAQATDPATGRVYLVREYLPEAVGDPLSQRRRFIAVAKSLRAVSSPLARVLFAYTRDGHCYTVADPTPGTALSTLCPAGRTPESECLVRLHALLATLQQLHTAGASAGPLFHGNLRAENVFAPSASPDSNLRLRHGLYLDNLLRETPLPPEHFQTSDLIACADLVLTLAGGFGTPAERLPRLQRIAHPVLGATLQYLYGSHGAQATTASAALDYLNLTERAFAGRDRSIFERAIAIAPSPRLLQFAAPPVPPPAQPPPQPAPAPAPARPTQSRPPMQPPPPAPPQGVRYRPVPKSAPTPPVVRRAPRKRSSGCGGCLVTLLLAILVVVAVVVTLNKPPSGPTSLDLSASPNPAPRHSQVELQWTSSGFDRVQLDGRNVQANGSIVVIANAFHHYRLTGIRRDGSRVFRELDLMILPRHTGKPAAGTPLAIRPEGSTQQPELDHPFSEPRPEVQPSQAAPPAANERSPPAPIVRRPPTVDSQSPDQF